MAKLKNISKGPRGIWSAAEKRMVVIEPGQTVEVDVTPADIKDAPYFEVDGKLSKVAEVEKGEAEDAKAPLSAADGVDKIYTDEEIAELRETAKGLKIKHTQKTTGAELEKKIAEAQAA